jgi:hypothetical protein
MPAPFKRELLCAVVRNKDFGHLKGEVMKKHVLRILLALVGFAGLSGIAEAQTSREIVVTLPFEFMVAGKTLPAGTYTVTRVSYDNSELVLSNQAKRVSALVHAIEIESAHSGKPSVSFERVGESRFLTRIATVDNVYSIPISGLAIIDESGR